MEVTTIKKAKDLKSGDEVIYIDKELLMTTVLKVINIVYSKYFDIYIITLSNENEDFKLCMTCSPESTGQFIQDNEVVFFNKQSAIDYLEGLILDIKDEIKNITSIKL